MTARRMLALVRGLPPDAAVWIAAPAPTAQADRDQADRNLAFARMMASRGA